MSKWQPIETAPRDGTFVLVSCVGADLPAIAAWRKEQWMEPHHVLEGDVDYDSWPVSHWMPLPEPPK